MKRLSYKYNDSFYMRGEVDWQGVLKRLCEYEDTGLTPEEITDLKEKINNVRPRITELVENGDLVQCERSVRR